jgi:hypothetical protein
MFCAAGLSLLAATSVSFAQQPELVRVRGTIEAVDGAMLTVKSRDNQTFYKIRVAGDAVVRGLVQASLAEIKDNTFIGVSGLPQPDGSQKALEIHIFPEAMRGTGEGHQPWDLVPNSTMTNAAVAQMVKAVDGDEITVKIQGRRKEDHRPAADADRDLRSRRQERAQAGREDIHRRRAEEGRRHARSRLHCGRPRRRPPADVRPLASIAAVVRVTDEITEAAIRVPRC